MTTRPIRVEFCLLALSAAAATAGAQNDCTGNPWESAWKPDWKPLFKGIEWAGACTTRLPSNPGTPGVRTQRVNALRIDLKDPDIRFFSTPRAPQGGTQFDTKGQVASELLCEYGLQVVINASFSWPCCHYETEKNPPDFKLCGLARSAGATVSELSSVPDPSYSGATALMITGKNEASFRTITALNDCIPADICTAVAGGPQVAVGNYCPQKAVPGPLMLLQDGMNMSCAASDANPPETVAPRTAVGLSRDGRSMLMITIDGEEGTSGGAGFYDTAEWLLRLGAFNAMNLDGGGSTTMVIDLPGSLGGARILNHPSHNCEQRYVGNFLGVKAQLLHDPFVPPSGCGPAGHRSCPAPPKPLPACPVAGRP
jgi:hypothetical protein